MGSGIVMRIGHGYDVHATGHGEGVVLGGVRIPCELALRAHSDGDVVLHALADALLGAAALGDIGAHFPDDDAAWRHADSRELLGRIRALVSAAGWQPVNVDISVIAEQPRLRPHVEAMRSAIAHTLGLSASAVSVKATTHEGLDAVGRGEGIAAHAVCLLMAAD